MNKGHFKENTRYAVTIKDENRTLRPTNIYIYRLYPDYMIARHMSTNGLLFKISYHNIVKIVKEIPVAPEARFMVPEMVLNPDNWENKSQMVVYGSSPGVGK